tara:strand:- start:926 stop:2416 length:1491 start_codon:yes stop_codon:yes gene_type:complete
MASALEWQQKPVNTTSKVPVITNWTPVIGYMLFQDDATTASYFYYKLVLEVRLNDASGTLLAKIKQRRNGYSSDVTNNKARAFFDLREIVNSQLVHTVFDQNDSGVPFRTLHKVGANTATLPFSVNGDRNTDETQIQKIYVKGYQEYSTSASASPSEVTSDSVNDTLYYLQASLPLMTPRSTDANYIQGTDFNVYNSSGATDKFLSDVETDSGDYNTSGYINYVQWNDTTEVGDYHTVAFLNDNSNFDSALTQIQIAYYNSSNALIGDAEYIANTNTNGGEVPTDGSLTNSERLLYFGCGPANLEAQSRNTDARPSNKSGWAYYTIRGTSDTPTNPATSTNKTAAYYFIKQDGSCKGYNVRRLAWINSKGGYDYFNFKLKSTQTVNVERNNYNKMLGTFSGSKWRYNNTQRGKTTRQTTATLKEIINTDYISEQQANLIEKLIMSSDVQVVENSDTTYTQAVMITSSSHVRKTVANDKLIQYTIEIEYANPLNTNS